MVDGLWLFILAVLEVWGLWQGRSLLILGTTLALLVSGSLMLWKRWCLAGVTYERHLSEHRAVFGQEVGLSVELLNLKPLPLTWLQVEDTFPRSLVFEGGYVRPGRSELFRYFTMVVAMLPYERIVRKLVVKCNRRGEHVFGPTSLESGDYLGALVNYGSIRAIDHLLVLPKIMRLAIGGMKSNQILGRDAVRRLFMADPIRIVGARDYTPGDPYRLIDWRASARVGNLMVRLIEPSTTPAVDILIDFAVPTRANKNFEPDELEFAISIAASLVTYAIEQRWSVGLGGNGTSMKLPLTLPPSRAPDRLGAMLEVLSHASVVPNGSFVEAVVRHHAESPTGTTFVVVTMNLVSTLAALGDLSRRGRPVTVIQIVAGTEDVTALRWAAGPIPIWQASYDTHWTERETLVLNA